METFLSKITREVLSRGIDWRDVSMVVPSRRAGVFLRREIARQYPRDTFLPRILTIEDLAVQIARIEKAEDLPLLFEFYRAYQACTSEQDRESFDVAARWGQTLLSDFNEIDRYLLPCKDVFSTLQDVEHIENWDPSAPLSPLMEQHKNFWHLAEKLYHTLREQLLSQGIGYPGMVLRRAAENIGRSSDTLQEHTRWIFAGFNAMSSAEQRILKYFVEEKDAEIYYDADRYYLDNPRHSAGTFLRRLKDDAVLGRNFRWIGQDLSCHKTLHILGVPREVSQAKAAAQVLRESLSEGHSTEDTALVLADESLLIPMLSSLPEEIPSVNVTMGYPLSGLPSSGLADALLDLYSTPEKLDLRGYYHKDVISLLRQNVCTQWFSDNGTDYAGILSRKIVQNDLVDIDGGRLAEGLPEKIAEKTALLLGNRPDTPLEVCRRVLRMVEAIRTQTAQLDDLTREYLYKLSEVFTTLTLYMERYPYVENLSTLRSFYRQGAALQKIDFFGEPLEGLQLMGLLETRLLDFRRLIITGVNEGVLPHGRTDNSFIPYDVKRHFALPTYSEKDAVYAYHFFRLLSRAEHITLLYNTQQGDLGQAEPSRFLQQLRHDFAHRWDIRESVLSFGIPALPQRPLQRGKTPFALARIREILAQGLSPSTLNMYLCNPMEFYYRKVLGVGEPETVEETAAANTMGSIVHEVLQRLYEPHTGIPLTEALLKELDGQADQAVAQAFEREMNGRDYAHGRNFLVYQAVRRMIHNLLAAERDELRRGARIVLQELETSLECTLEGGVEGTPVRLKGQADRIDTYGGTLRIVDYKTGRAEASELRIDRLEAFVPSFLDEQGKAVPFTKPKALQVLLYAYLYERSRGIPGHSFRSGILSLRHPSAGLIGLNFTTDKARTYRYDLTREDLLEFEAVLRNILSGLLDPDRPFEEAGEIYYDI